MTRRIFLARSAALAAVGAFGAAALHFLSTPAASAPPDGDRWKIGGPFNLVDHRGRRVSDSDFRGRHMLVFFGYVQCPDVCPTGLRNASLALEQLGADVEKIVPIFITVDPRRDTPGVLGEYLSNFHKSFVGLTGSAEDIDKAAKAYRVPYGKEDDSKAENYVMYHAAFFFLMGPDGKFEGGLGHDYPSERMAEIMRKFVKD